MMPIVIGWIRIAEPLEGGKAYWNRESGLYALVNPDGIQVTRQGYRPSLSDCSAALSAFQMKDAQEVSTGRNIFRRFEKKCPMIFGKQVDLFGE